MRIPKLLFSTCSKSQTKIGILNTQRSLLLRNNPDWRYQCFGDEDCKNFMKEAYAGDVYKAFQKINPHYGAAKADLFRYCLMYKYGGIYLDYKSSARTPLTKLLKKDDSYILSQWDNGQGEAHEGWGLHNKVKSIEGGEYQQWIIICTPKHPFLRDVIDNVVANIQQYPNRTQYHSGRMGVLEITGPIAYTEAIQNHIITNSLISGKDYRMIKAKEKGLIYSVFEDTHYLNVDANISGTSCADTHRNNAYMRSHYSRRRDPIVINPCTDADNRKDPGTKEL